MQMPLLCLKVIECLLWDSFAEKWERMMKIQRNVLCLNSAQKTKSQRTLELRCFLRSTLSFLTFTNLCIHRLSSFSDKHHFYIGRLSSHSSASLKVFLHTTDFICLHQLIHCQLNIEWKLKKHTCNVQNTNVILCLSVFLENSQSPIFSTSFWWIIWKYDFWS